MYVQQFTTPPVFQKQHYVAANGDSMHLSSLNDSKILSKDLNKRNIVADQKMKEAALTLLSVSPTFTAQAPPKNPLETLCSAAVNSFSLGPSQTQKKGSSAVSKGSLWNRSISKSSHSVSKSSKRKATAILANSKSASTKKSRIMKVYKENQNKSQSSYNYFPCTLELKYKPVYNKGGRIGIYDRTQRSKIIQNWLRKRLKRVWVKKVRYSCRQNLAESRVRVKGRFVSTKNF
mmetsp:Transcript_6161/g.7771  ORF Transcript_6161/g.7771 Transcript_6161/m.7771 type:complete len:233 (-) Transcript_6161:1168-1866(-)